MLKVTKETFHGSIRKNENYLNCGCTTIYDPVENVTLWIVANQTIGRSGGRVGSSTFYEINIDICEEV